MTTVIVEATEQTEERSQSLRKDKLDPTSQYRTATGRVVYVVHSNPNGRMVPVNGDNGTVRVEYLNSDGQQVEDYGWELPTDLTRAES